jgi:thiosulfate/3-mercaptopyruvate sulfurtransferase
VFTTLISVEELAANIDSCKVFDIQHDLFKPEAGYAAYMEGHIPSAYFLDNTDDLAGPKEYVNGVPITGRHPLPIREVLAAKLRACGLNSDQQVVVYDASNGMFAVRLWWLLQWLGHEKVALLDGGLNAWKAAKYPLSQEATKTEANAEGDFLVKPPRVSFVPVEELQADVVQSRTYLIVDARAPERFRGEVEPLDPVAGHIPGAVNRPFQQNLRPDGRFKPAPFLRQEFLALFGERDASEIVSQCGSGVTACHNLLAMAHAGLPGAHLYPGSWSEWCASPDRPVITLKA